MRHYLKILLLLLLTAVFLIIVYVFVTNSFFTEYNLKRNEKYHLINEEYEENRALNAQRYNVWCVFTKLKKTERSLEYKLKNMLISLVNTTSLVINLNIVVDTSSRYVAKDVVNEILKITGKKFEVEYHDVHVLTNKLQDLLNVMRPHFSSQPGAYYSDSLFFLSLGLYRVAPINQDRIIMLDIDTLIKKDIGQLFKVFQQFNSTNVFGASPELTPVYHHILYVYRNKHKNTSLGEPQSSGGFPGVNSGVLLLHLDNMRKSSLYQKMLTKEIVDSLAEKYSFKGHLGDQDFYTLISLEHPELMYLLDCGWNRQLCTWWRDHGYRETFHKFSECNSPTKIYHGNCNSIIPEQ
ncbi:xyloside xylosyltransferase [Rhodnius prolixus]|uniref:Putative xyloside xylosyltransferase 1 n=2 Tax=Rhodnius TaxID=13248 RepID=A0A4P6D8X5_RHOPR